MKTVLYFFVSVILLCSCVSYSNLYQVSSSSKGVKELNRYEYEDDKVKITYFFWDLNGTMAFSVYNKMEIPMYIDWKKSSLVRNSVKADYWIDEVNTKSKSDGSGSPSLYYGSFDFSSITLSKSVKSERVTFIAPKSTITRVRDELFNLEVERVSRNAESTIISCPYNGNKIPTKVDRYTIEKNPFIFRNFITISNTEDFAKEYYIDNEFYVSGIYKVKDKYFRRVYKDGNATETVQPMESPKMFYSESY